MRGILCASSIVHVAIRCHIRQHVHAALQLDLLAATKRGVTRTGHVWLARICAVQWWRSCCNAWRCAATLAMFSLTPGLAYTQHCLAPISAHETSAFQAMMS